MKERQQAVSLLLLPVPQIRLRLLPRLRLGSSLARSPRIHRREEAYEERGVGRGAHTTPGWSSLLLAPIYLIDLRLPHPHFLEARGAGGGVVSGPGAQLGRIKLHSL